MNFTVRLLKEEDREQLMDLMNEYVREYVKKENLVPTHFDPKIGDVYWRAMKGKWEDNVGIVAIAENAMIGFCLGGVHHFNDFEKVYFDGDRHGELWDVYTKPDWQGKGVGKEMMALAEKELIKKGCPNVLLKNVNVENHGAKRLYEKLGYKPYVLEYFKSLEQD